MTSNCQSETMTGRMNTGMFAIASFCNIQSDAKVFLLLNKNRIHNFQHYYSELF
jgi:hypothetical protein